MSETAVRDVKRPKARSLVMTAKRLGMVQIVLLAVLY
jgi:hypothetical protein